MSCPHGVWHEDDCEHCTKENELHNRIADRERAYELLSKENAKLRSLIELIFASTLPYNDGEPTFSDKVTDAWAELSPSTTEEGK